jgi:lysophospholipase L1-like esterase
MKHNIKRYISGLLPKQLKVDIKRRLLFSKELGSIAPFSPFMTRDEKEVFQNCIKILFAGDLILIEDQVKDAFDGNEYNFTPVFTHTKEYISQADLSIGVFEGPCAGKEAGYSTGNIRDGIPHTINFPDSFAIAVKEAGFGLVTTAGNHILQKGEMGLFRTLDVLDRAGLDHCGTYRNQAERDSVKMLDIKGIKCALLSYTLVEYLCRKGYTNQKQYAEEYFLEGEGAVLTSVLVSPKSRNFDKAKELVLADFQKAKKESPDLIIVLPHMGTAFSHELDSYQAAWNKIFADAGADIVFGDHVHVVQPIEFVGSTLIVNCPGHFVDNYIEQNCDASSMVEAYINPKTKRIEGAAVIPMWVRSPIKGQYQPIPLYDILTRASPIAEQVSKFELEHVNKVHSIVTKVMLGQDIKPDMTEPRYYITKNGFIRNRVKPLEISVEYKETELWRMIESSDTVCFIGDNITAGTKNGGYGWHEPIMENFPDKKVNVAARDGQTVLTLLGALSEKQNILADMYIIAIGMNDIRYRRRKICAMTAEQYIAEISKIVEKTGRQAGARRMVFINPWLVLPSDPFYKLLPAEDRSGLHEKYGNALRHYCHENNFIYIDPNPYIRNILSLWSRSKYMLDYMHPNKSQGIYLYSKAVLMSGMEKR